MVVRRDFGAKESSKKDKPHNVEAEGQDLNVNVEAPVRQERRDGPVPNMRHLDCDDEGRNRVETPAPCGDLLS